MKGTKKQAITELHRLRAEVRRLQETNERLRAEVCRRAVREGVSAMRARDATGLTVVLGKEPVTLAPPIEILTEPDAHKGTIDIEPGEK